MKALLISSVCFPPYKGGISHLMSSLASSLGPQQVCCLTGVECNSRSSDNGPKIYRKPNVFSQSTITQAWNLAFTVPLLMFQERPNVILLATANHEGYLGLALQRWLGLPFVVFAHGSEILEAMRIHWPRPRMALQKASRVLAVSSYTGKLVEQVGVAPERIAVVNPGCDTERFRPLAPKPELRRKLLGARERDRVILTIGNLVPRKGQDMVIRALPHVLRNAPDVSYLIVGDGWYRAELENLARNIGVANRVIFAGQLGDEDLPDVYALCDVFAMPSRAQVELSDVEGFGMVFLEANACAKPVVAGDSGGVPDAVVAGKTGLLVNPIEVRKIADALCRLLTDSKLARSLGEQGRARIVAHFAWKHMAGRIQEILEHVVEERQLSN